MSTEIFFVPARIYGELPSGQKIIGLMITGADGLRITTDADSLILPKELERVTHCKDCNHWVTLPSCPTLGRCTFMRNGLQTGAEYFCASAVRKEERDRETN